MRLRCLYVSVVGLIVPAVKRYDAYNEGEGVRLGAAYNPPGRCDMSFLLDPKFYEGAAQMLENIFKPLGDVQNPPGSGGDFP
jgi:hypothetical protein